MSDSDKPFRRPPQQQQPQQQPPRPGQRPESGAPPEDKEKDADRPRAAVERLRGRQTTGKPPSLDERDLGYGFGGPVNEFDTATERDLERELREAMGELSDIDMKQLVGHGRQQRQAVPPPQGGQQEQPVPGKAVPRKGKVISVRGKDVFLDIGGRTQGVMTLNQFPEGPPAPGDLIDVFIEGGTPDGLVLLTREGSAVEADWSTVAVGMLVEARVTAVNKGGLSVDVNGIRGFMPMGHIDLYRVEDATPYVNQKLRCLVSEVDREDRNLVVSRRALLEREREEMKEKTWAELEEGQVREGVVRSVRPFGAFVDLGGVDGLLPVGEMSWQRIKSPEEVVQPGMRVRVQVLRIDRETRKLTLGLRQLTMSPWDSAPADYPIGSVVRGKVTRTADFGAFVEVGPAIEGLVHISEISTQRVQRVTQVVQVGQEVNVKVLNIDIAARRMSLSMKQATAPPEPDPEDEDDAEETPAPRKRTTPLRGGVGSKNFPPKE